MSHLKSVHLKCVCLKNVLSKIRPSKKRRGPEYLAQTRQIIFLSEAISAINGLLTKVLVP